MNLGENQAWRSKRWSYNVIRWLVITNRTVKLTGKYCRCRPFVASVWTRSSPSSPILRGTRTFDEFFFFFFFFLIYICMHQLLMGPSFIHVMAWHQTDAKPLPGGRFKNVFELLNLRSLKISMLYNNHIFQCMGKIFCVEFQRVPSKFHTKYLTHTMKDVDFIHRWKFKSS